MWTWLDKHGDTPVLRENFKHLVSICTVKPAKVAVQPLQRNSSDVQVLSTSRAQTQDYGQSLQHQRSTRFIPAASISGRPAATARPASASAARRKLVVGHRPSTAAPGEIGNACPTLAAKLLQRAVVIFLQLCTVGSENSLMVYCPRP